MSKVPEDVVRDFDWQFREENRFVNGEYKHPVWIDEDFWIDSSYIRAKHYVHVHPTKSGILLYTANEDKGERDIQTPIRIGRYLTKYFNGILNEKQIKFYTEWQTTGELKCEYTDESQWELLFATTPRGIVNVYQQGPSSCMDGDHFDRGDNPTRVYGAGDLAIAYLYNEHAEHPYRARCLVWPAKLVAGRVYPTPQADYWRRDGFTSKSDAALCQRALETRLRNLGYRFHDDCRDDNLFKGARLLKIEHEDGYMMPYLDKSYHVDDAGGYFRMDRYGDLEADSTEGWISIEDSSWSCQNCDERYRDDYTPHTVFSTYHPRWYGENPRTWCAYCVENSAFTCSGCHETFDENVDHIWIGDESYVLEWAKEHGAYQSDFSGKWYFEDDDAKVTLSDGRIVAKREAEENLPDYIDDARQAELEGV